VQAHSSLFGAFVSEFSPARAVSGEFHSCKVTSGPSPTSNLNGTLLFRLLLWFGFFSFFRPLADVFHTSPPPPIFLPSRDETTASSKHVPWFRGVLAGSTVYLLFINGFFSFSPSDENLPLNPPVHINCRHISSEKPRYFRPTFPPPWRSWNPPFRKLQLLAILGRAAAFFCPTITP